MILVDTSVWIGFLEGNDHWTKDRLKEFIAERRSIAYLDMILLEILMGIRSQNEREKLVAGFHGFLELSVKKSTILLASQIYQNLQRKGVRIRSIIDCLIGAVSIETGAVILHKDRDFEYIEQYFPVFVEKK
jgi:predicted nucleic acid-binding protein